LLLSFSLSEHLGADPKKSQTGLEFRRQGRKGDFLAVGGPGCARRKKHLQAETADTLNLGCINVQRISALREKILLQLSGRLEVENGG